jgi:hypothetical protein
MELGKVVKALSSVESMLKVDVFSVGVCFLREVAYHTRRGFVASS